MKSIENTKPAWECIKRDDHWDAVIYFEDEAGELMGFQFNIMFDREAYDKLLPQDTEDNTV